MNPPMNTHAEEMPEPPEGYRIVTEEEKQSKPLPIDALNYCEAVGVFPMEWCPSGYRGKLLPELHRDLIYATRTVTGEDEGQAAARQACVELGHAWDNPLGVPRTTSKQVTFPDTTHGEFNVPKPEFEYRTFYKRKCTRCETVEKRQAILGSPFAPPATADEKDAEIARLRRERDEIEAELENYRSIAEKLGAEKAVSQLATLRARLSAATALIGECKGALGGYLELEERRYIQEEIETGVKRPLERRNKQHQIAHAALAHLASFEQANPKGETL